jgi:hypothetical protein
MPSRVLTRASQLLIQFFKEIIRSGYAEGVDRLFEPVLQCHGSSLGDSALSRIGAAPRLRKEAWP